MISAYGQSPKGYYALTPQEVKVLKERVEAVPDTLKTQFESLFKQWMQEWQTNPKTRLSSSTTSATQLKTFSPLVKLGEGILPLVVDKLRDKQNFVAVVLYNQLQPNAALKPTAGSEQQKAEAILRKWLE